MSPEYAAALAKANAAGRVFAAVQESYRSRLIGDAEFIAGRNAYDAANAEFDIAFAAEDHAPEAVEPDDAAPEFEQVAFQF